MPFRISEPRSTGAADKDRLLDRMIERYVDRREASVAVHDAYANWCGAPIAQRSRSFLAYRAALDREESAATRYGSVIEGGSEHVQ
jgi:hypothetical protein